MTNYTSYSLKFILLERINEKHGISMKKESGEYRIRTGGLLHAMQAL